MSYYSHAYILVYINVFLKNWKPYTHTNAVLFHLFSSSSYYFTIPDRLGKVHFSGLFLCFCVDNINVCLSVSSFSVLRPFPPHTWVFYNYMPEKGCKLILRRIGHFNFYHYFKLHLYIYNLRMLFLRACRSR